MTGVTASGGLASSGGTTPNIAPAGFTTGTCVRATSATAFASAAGDCVTGVTAGTNITTTGTATVPIVNTALAPTFNSVLFSGAAAPAGTSVYVANDNAVTNGLLLNVPTSSTNGFQFTVNNVAVASISAIGAGVFGASATFTANATLPANSAVYIANDNAATKGLQFNVPTGSTNGFRFMVNGAKVASIPAAGLTSGGTQCLQANSAGDISGTGVACPVAAPSPGIEIANLYVNTFGNALAVTSTPPQVTDQQAPFINVGGTFQSPVVSGLRVFCQTAAVGATNNIVRLYRGPAGANFVQIGTDLTWTTALVANVTFTAVALSANDVLQVLVAQVDTTPPKNCVVAAEGLQGA